MNTLQNLNDFIIKNFKYGIWHTKALITAENSKQSIRETHEACLPTYTTWQLYVMDMWWWRI